MRMPNLRRQDDQILSTLVIDSTTTLSPIHTPQQTSGSSEESVSETVTQEGLIESPVWVKLRYTCLSSSCCSERDPETYSVSSRRKDLHEEVFLETSHSVTGKLLQNLLQQLFQAAALLRRLTKGAHPTDQVDNTIVF